MAQLLAPYHNGMRLGQGFNSYTQQICLDHAVLLDTDENRKRVYQKYTPDIGNPVGARKTGHKHVAPGESSGEIEGGASDDTATNGEHGDKKLAQGTGKQVVKTNEEGGGSVVAGMVICVLSSETS
jgi:hypothetical protein